MALRSFARPANLPPRRSAERDPQPPESATRATRERTEGLPLRGLRLAGLLLVAAVSSGMACEPPSHTCHVVYAESKPTEEQLRRARLACITPAVGHCEGDDVWTFHSIQKTQTLTATITCKERRPWGRFELAGGRATGVAEGEFPQAVWEALYRVVVDAKYCAGIGAAPMEVTTRGKTATCKTPRDDVSRLVAEAWKYTKQSAPRGGGETATDGICDLDPNACRQSDDPCPVFQGDIWAGQRRPNAETVDPDAP